MLWHCIGVYIINITLHGRLKIRNSLLVLKNQRTSEIFFNTRREISYLLAAVYYPLYINYIQPSNRKTKLFVNFSVSVAFRQMRTGVSAEVWSKDGKIGFLFAFNTRRGFEILTGAEQQGALKPMSCKLFIPIQESVQSFRERLSEKMCTRQSRKVIWDMMSYVKVTLSLTTIQYNKLYLTSNLR